MLACDLAAGLRAGGANLLDRLDELAAAHGVHLTEGVSVRMEPGSRDAVVARLVAAPPPGWDASRPAPDVLVLRRAAEGSRGGERVVVRPSGTEPKLKAYLQVVEPPDPDVRRARARAQRRLEALRAEVHSTVVGGEGGQDELPRTPP